MKQLTYFVLIFALLSLTNCGNKEKASKGEGEKEPTEMEKLAEANKDLEKKTFKITTAGAEILNEEGKIDEMFKVPPFKIKMKAKKEMQEGTEVTVRTATIFKNDEKIAMRYNGQIDLLSDDFETEKGIKIGSTIEDFAKAYPDYKIWYTYVSGKYVIETPTLPDVQFILDPLSFTGDENMLNESDMIELNMGYMDKNGKITTIKVFEEIGC